MDYQVRVGCKCEDSHSSMVYQLANKFNVPPCWISESPISFNNPNYSNNIRDYTIFVAIVAESSHQTVLQA